ncbi:hypothetical protein LshimejAT787_0902910 [Lyophyllum shimeji]|uniref:Uncharacterized protein n=1 Tax=Lyophyllum shimeji TaxID=47721 RepID=A0A9P3PSS8_LYOSH|nr:hypothetical protein LshimejAT787_0902910 [Lyophyllum shimeji]
MPDEKREISELHSQETRLALFSFNSSTVWDLGSAIRALALKEYPEQSAYITITHANGTPLFVAHTTDSLSPGYVAEAEAIRNSVRRWEISSWRRNRLLALTEAPSEYDKAEAKSAEFSLKGGGWPIRVKGVVGVVAIVVVTGLFSPHNGKAQSFNPLKYDRPTDANHELVVKALDMVLDKQKNSPVPTSDRVFAPDSGRNWEAYEAAIGYRGDLRYKAEYEMQ